MTAHGFSPCSDLRGLWIYKLESRVGINYWLKCLAWTGQQQEPRAWSQGLPTCPCSLQQGQRDPRFKSSRGGKWTRLFLTLLIPKLSFPTFPARVAGVPAGRVGRSPEEKERGDWLALQRQEKQGGLRAHLL